MNFREGDVEGKARLAAFLERMQELGWSEGRKRTTGRSRAIVDPKEIHTCSWAATNEPTRCPWLFLMPHTLLMAPVAQAGSRKCSVRPRGSAWIRVGSSRPTNQVLQSGRSLTGSSVPTLVAALAKFWRSLSAQAGSRRIRRQRLLPITPNGLARD
jgi:hypothetical protein